MQVQRSAEDAPERAQVSATRDRQARADFPDDRVSIARTAVLTVVSSDNRVEFVGRESLSRRRATRSERYSSRDNEDLSFFLPLSLSFAVDTDAKETGHRASPHR